MYALAPSRVHPLFFCLPSVCVRMREGGMNRYGEPGLGPVLMITLAQHRQLDLCEYKVNIGISSQKYLTQRDVFTGLSFPLVIATFTK